MDSDFHRVFPSSPEPQTDSPGLHPHLLPPEMQDQIERFATELSASNEAAQIVKTELTKLLAEELQLTDTLRQLRSEIERDKHELAAARNKVEAHRIDRANLSAEVENIRKEKELVLAQLRPLRAELDERIWVREALINQVTILHGHVENLQKQKSDLDDEVKALAAQHQSLDSKVEPAPSSTIDSALPLLFSDESRPISKQWDSYPLESEFYTDEIQDAGKVADLVAKLPGLNGSLLLKNKGSVLASNLSEHLYDHLKVPERNYDELFEHLPNSVRKYDLNEVRLETFSLEKESLTVAKAGDAFLVVSHPQTKLRPGVLEKLATVTVELAKMYEDGTH
jgi:DNA repair exonuclease SbcCD ATPase subunit